MSNIKNNIPNAICGNTGECITRAYNFYEPDENELEINMYGEVVETIPVDWWTGKPVEGMYICEKEFLDELGKYKQKDRITVRINSVGGDLYAGLAIANRMKELKAEIITIVDALCASAAVAIQQAGTIRKVFEGSQVMIHEPSCYIYGRYDAQGIQKVQKQLEAGKKTLIKTYQARTGRSEEELEKMITQDSWMTGEEAVKEGFADEVIEGETDTGISEDKKTVISNGIRFPTAAFFSLPPNLKVLKNEAGTEGNIPITNTENEKGEKKKMTRNELMESDPELYNEIIQEARKGQETAISDALKAERDRIREIDEIANQVGDEEMVNSAKFGDKPMNAAELALAAMKKQKKLGNDFLGNLNSDANASGAGDVKPTPNSGTKSREEQELQDIMNGAALIIGKKEEMK